MSEVTHMHDVALDDDTFVSVPLPAEATSSSVLDAIKAERSRIAQRQAFDLIVPGMGDLVALRLGPIAGASMTRLAERARRGASNDVDVLITAFQAVLVRGRPTQEFAPLIDGDGDPVGLDDRLAAMFGLGEMRTAREVVYALYARANSPAQAISAGAGEWWEWARSADTEVDESFMGE